MATVTAKRRCVECNKEKNTYECRGCSQNFCFNHLSDHRQTVNKQFDKIEDDCNSFLQTFIEQKDNTKKRPLIQEIDQWEEDSIKKIKQTAERCRQILIKCTNENISGIEKKFDNLTKQLKRNRDENELDEIDLNQITEALKKLVEELYKPPYLSVEQESTSFINEIFVHAPLGLNTTWEKNGITIVGGNGSGNKLNQLSYPEGLFIDDDQMIYIADYCNHRIVKWRYNAKNGQIVAGRYGQGNKTNQLHYPKDVILNKENNSLIISDWKNRRVMQWSRQNNTNGKIIISNIDCYGLAIDKNGYLYISDYKKHEVRRLNKVNNSETIVAGGNGEGDHLNQLNHPTFIFVDQDDSLYVSDNHNNRVMKWVKDAKEGIVVAGGNGEGSNLTQLSKPQKVIVDQLGQIYVADMDNNRVMRWCKGATEGVIVVGGNGQGQQSNQLNHPYGLSFDQQSNLHVVDGYNHRIQKFEIDLY